MVELLVHRLRIVVHWVNRVNYIERSKAYWNLLNSKLQLVNYSLVNKSKTGAKTDKHWISGMWNYFD